MFYNHIAAACLSLVLATGLFALQAVAGDAAAGGSQNSSSEKEAFENAKALGTAEAWQAFLTHYPSGFHADLARAYLARFGAKPAAAPATPTTLAPPPPPVAPAPAAPSPITRVRHPGGEFYKSSATGWIEQGPSGRAIFNFEEISRTAQGIELYDASRRVYLTLDIANRIIWYRDPSTARTRLYDIVETGNSQASYPAMQTYEVAPPALPPARVLSCGLRSSIASNNSDTPVKVTFINNSAVQRGVFWIDFKGNIKNYADLSAGQQVTLDTFLTHPWLITDGPGNCVKIVMPEPGASIAYLADDGRAGQTYEQPRTAPTYFTTRPKPVVKSYSCGSGKVRVDGKCIRRADVAGFCGPGYRMRKGKCVPGAYEAPKKKDGLPSWQKEAISKGCLPGQGWNAQEGCHEND